VLFDPATAPSVDDRIVVTFDHAIRHDLMSYLAGDVTYVPKEGSGFQIIADRTGEKMPTNEGFHAMFTVTHAHFHDADGTKRDISSV
jgi:hypothetical protein